MNRSLAVRIIALLLLLPGGALLARAAFLHAKGALAMRLIEHAWNTTRASGRESRPWPGADTCPIGVLTIPSVRLRSIVLAAGSPRSLAFGAVHLSNSAAPDEPGNIVLAGHRTTEFRVLEEVSLGDEILFETAPPGGPVLRRYRVEALAVADASDTRLLGPTAEDRLTLVTCWPFGYGPSSPKRWIVRARRVP